jgi:RimJ/RimL family protein N-acetyltransferase
LLRKRDIHDSNALFELMSHPEVFPYVREKAQTIDEYMFVMKSLIDAEENGELISRVITDDYGRLAGTINLFDIQNKTGYLATWLGKPFHGQGYNKMAKELFFQELYENHQIENILIKIRKVNVRSIQAIKKFSYIEPANTLFEEEYNRINENGDLYDLYVVNKMKFLRYMNKNLDEELDEELMEA